MHQQRLVIPEEENLDNLEGLVQRHSQDAVIVQVQILEQFHHLKPEDVFQ